MPLPAESDSLFDVWRRVKSIARRTRLSAVKLQQSAASGPVARFEFIEFIRELNTLEAEFGIAAVVPGLPAYAAAQSSIPALDLVVELSAASAAAEDLRAWLVGAFPKHTDGSWRVRAFDSAGAPVEITFSQADLSPFVTRVATFIATIA